MSDSVPCSPQSDEGDLLALWYKFQERLVIAREEELDAFREAVRPTQYQRAYPSVPEWTLDFRKGSTGHLEQLVQLYTVENKKEPSQPIVEKYKKFIENRQCPETPERLEKLLGKKLFQKVSLCPERLQGFNDIGWRLGRKQRAYSAFTSCPAPTEGHVQRNVLDGCIHSVGSPPASLPHHLAKWAANYTLSEEYSCSQAMYIAYVRGLKLNGDDGEWLVYTGKASKGVIQRWVENTTCHRANMAAAVGDLRARRIGESLATDVEYAMAAIWLLHGSLEDRVYVLDLGSLGEVDVAEALDALENAVIFEAKEAWKNLLLNVKKQTPSLTVLGILVEYAEARKQKKEASVCSDIRAKLLTACNVEGKRLQAAKGAP